MTPAPPTPFVFRSSKRVLAIIDEMFGRLPDGPVMSHRHPLEVMSRGLRVKALRELCGMSYPAIAMRLHYSVHGAPQRIVARSMFDAEEYRQVEARVLQEMPGPTLSSGKQEEVAA